MKEIKSDPEMVAYCGLYCGACGSYLKDKCPGCHDNAGAKWCKIKVCCEENQYQTCADCKEYDNPRNCSKFSNLMSKLFALIFRSDRAACIDSIRDLGVEGYADKMSELKQQSIKK